MKKLSQLVDCDYYDIDVLGIATDSRNVKPGYLFVATKGFHVDHYNYITDAIDKGCVAVVVDRVGKFSVPTIVVDDINQTLISICEKFYDVTTHDFTFIGITGTDGKTTTATITRNLLNHFIPTAYLGTNGLYCGDKIFSTTNTTPCVEDLYYYFSIVKFYKCQIIVMEVSSEALLHHRVDSIIFDVVAYTNITEDHLNIHKTIENYRNCKFRLATLCKRGASVIINGDDDNCRLLNVKYKTTYGFSSDNDCVISDVKNCQKNVYFSLRYLENKYLVQSPFLGKYNIYNVTLALLIVQSVAGSLDKAIGLLPSVPYVFGRREVFTSDSGFDILLDYAHTTNGILSLLQSLDNYSHIIVVTGAAGGREVEKRPVIGDILFKYADYIVFTSDDPRYEDPKDIFLDMLGSHKTENYTFIQDREEAILHAFQLAQDKDVVAVIGKGRDNYMAVLDQRIPYSDYDVILKFLKKFRFRQNSTRFDK